MNNHSELVNEARELADSQWHGDRTNTRRMLRKLANIITAYDKAESEAVAACRTCSEVIAVTLQAIEGRYIEAGSRIANELRDVGHLAKHAVRMSDKAEGGE